MAVYITLVYVTMLHLVYGIKYIPYGLHNKSYIPAYISMQY